MNERVTVPIIFKLLLPLVIGIVYAFYFKAHVGVELLYFGLIVLGVLSFPILSIRTFYTRLFALVSFFFFFILGVYLVNLNQGWRHDLYFAKNMDGSKHIYQGRILEPPIEKLNSYKLLLNIEKVGEVTAVGKTILYIQKSPEAAQLAYGDVIVFNALFNAVKPNGNPNEFDFSRYLRLHNIYHQGYAKTEDWRWVGNNANKFYTLVYDIRNYFDQVLENANLNSANLMVAKALILGKKDSLDRDTLRTYSSAGAMHVLAVSGLHVGIVMLLFSAIFKPLKMLPKGRVLFLIAVLVIIWTYAFITGMSSSVIRASVMFSFVLIGQELERDTTVYQSILISAFLMLIINPLIIFQVGFQLSYLAVIGIVYLQPKIYGLLYVKYYLIDKVWQITTVSIAAQIATFPLGLYYFHQFPNFFFVSNLIVIPLAFVILINGILYLFFSMVPLLNDLLVFTLGFLITLLNKGVHWVEQLPHSIYWGISIEWYEVFWYYLIIVLGVYAFVKRKAKALIFSLFCVLLLVLYSLVEDKILADRNTVVIYNVNDEIAIDVFYGRKNCFIGSETLINDEDKMLFHVMHNWFYRTGSEVANQAIIYDSSKNILEVGEKTLMIWDEVSASQYSKAIPKVDYIYFVNTNFLAADFIEDLKKRAVMVIVGDGNSYSFVNFLKKEIDKAQFHELKKEGAYEINFELSEK